MKIHGRWNDGTPNKVPAVIPPFSKVREAKIFYAAWMYQYFSAERQGWELIVTQKASPAEALEAAKEQCTRWKIPFVEKQWAIIMTSDSTYRQVV